MSALDSLPGDRTTTDPGLLKALDTLHKHVDAIAAAADAATARAAAATGTAARATSAANFKAPVTFDARQAHAKMAAAVVDAAAASTDEMFRTVDGRGLVAHVLHSLRTSIADRFVGRIAAPQQQLLVSSIVRRAVDIMGVLPESMLNAISTSERYRCSLKELPVRTVCAGPRVIEQGYAVRPVKANEAICTIHPALVLQCARLRASDDAHGTSAHGKANDMMPDAVAVYSALVTLPIEWVRAARRLLAPHGVSFGNTGWLVLLSSILAMAPLIIDHKFERSELAERYMLAVTLAARMVRCPYHPGCGNYALYITPDWDMNQARSGSRANLGMLPDARGSIPLVDCRLAGVQCRGGPMTLVAVQPLRFGDVLTLPTLPTPDLSKHSPERPVLQPITDMMRKVLGILVAVDRATDGKERCASEFENKQLIEACAARACYLLMMSVPEMIGELDGEPSHRRAMILFIMLTQADARSRHTTFLLFMTYVTIVQHLLKGPPTLEIYALADTANRLLAANIASMLQPTLLLELWHMMTTTLPLLLETNERYTVIATDELRQDVLCAVKASFCSEHLPISLMQWVFRNTGGVAT